MGPIAGLAAGLGIAALLSHLGMGEGMANIVMIALLAMAAVFVFRLLFRRNAPAAGPGNSGLQYAGAGRADMNTPFQAQQFGSASPEATSPVNVPEGFDSEAFVRIAKLNFVRLQAANDEKNIDDIREFTSPELFAEINMQMTERGDTPQQTDVVTLDAELLEVTTEANRHIASVRFSGMIREAADASAEPFEEIWNLSKPVEGNKGWVISGIQQTV
jgi:predicted lipid-binding transport protein (Tim44 family)